MNDNGSIEAGSRFLASTLHEVRTPIQTIISTVELLEDTPLNKEQTEYVHQIEFSANALLQLANDVLDFTKIRSDQFKLENIPYDVTELTERVVDLISMDAFSRNLEVVTDIDYSIPRTVMGDPNRVQQIILNLVKNAVKFTEKGFILVRLSQIKGHLLFEIADSGIGIPDDKKNLIFKDFYQIDASSTKRFSGTGLGLSICKNLVSVMNGKMGVLSNPSGGSNFWFALPLETSNIESEKITLQNIPSNTKVLLVEDNTLSQKSLKRKIETLGIKNYEIAGSSEEAIKKLKDASKTLTPFTIALIDLTMPIMDGWRLAEEINNNKSINNLRLYLMIPEGQMAKEAKMKLLNWYNGYIYKPIKIGKLAEILTEAFTQPLDLETIDNENKISSKQTAQNTTVQVAKDNKILIAEDHPVNRKLLQTILEKFGATVYLAENGEIAIEQINSHPEIDIIFMDIFMPIKSGIDATVEIRQNGYKGIIIACTANNNPEDFEAYSEMGINDILLKPFKRNAVQQILDKWNTVLSVPEAKELMNLIDINNQASDLWDISDFMDTTGHDIELAESLMDEYIDQTTEILEKLKAELYASKKNFDNIELYTHTLKGSSASVSAQKLSDIGKLMNDSAKQKDLITVEAGRTDFALEFRRLKNFVENWKTSL